MSGFEDHAKRVDIRNIIITSNITAFGILLAFLWKDVLAELFTVLLPQGKGLFSLFLTATAGTIIIALAAFLLLNTQKINRKTIYSFHESVKIRSYKPGKFKKIKEALRFSNRFRYSYKPTKRFYFF